MGLKLEDGSLLPLRVTQQEMEQALDSDRTSIAAGHADSTGEHKGIC